MLTRYDIFDDIAGLKNLVDEYFTSHRPAAGRLAEPPFVNIYEKGDTVTAVFQAPGVSIKDIDVKLVDTNLSVTIRREKDLKDKPYIRRERSFGSFSKTVRIPFRVNADSIKATLADGLLTITLEKSEDAKPKKITIQ